MKSIITITGDLGSGKSTVSAILAERLHYQRFSTGDLQRNLARQKGMTSLELNRYTESHPEIDRQIDEGVIALAEQHSRIIIDSRLAWHFVPESFKVYLTVDPMIASSRVLSSSRGEVERYATLEEAFDKLNQRRLSEKRRFKTLYDIDIDKPEHYSAIIDTTYSTPNEVAEKIIELHQCRQSSALTLNAWFNPKRLFPTKAAGQIGDEEVQSIIHAICSTGYDENFPVGIVQVGDNYFIYDGHRRVSAAITLNLIFIPCAILAADDRAVCGTISARQFVDAHFSKSNAKEWARAHSFAFPHYPA